jgi:hypothetical protein
MSRPEAKSKEDADRVGYWRLDEFFDFTIVIESLPSSMSSSVVTGTKREVSPKVHDAAAAKTYHVHRSQLSCGSRYSGYFRRLLRSEFKETKEACARFTLSSDMALAFPAFLDYLYFKDDSSFGFPVWSLAKLADYFDVKSLLQLAASLIAKKMFGMDSQEELDAELKDMPMAVSVSVMKSIMHLAYRGEKPHKVWSNT